MKGRMILGSLTALLVAVSLSFGCTGVKKEEAAPEAAAPAPEAPVAPAPEAAPAQPGQ